jgi:hypothetical protein
VRKKARKKEQTDSVDVLAKQYLAKFFDGPSSKPKGKAGAKGKPGGGDGAAAAMKRWFE